MYFDDKASGNKSTGDKSPIRLPKSPAIRAGFLKKSKTTFLSSNLNQLCDGLKTLLKEKQAGNNFDKIDGESIALADKLLEYKCISTMRHEFLLHKCLN